MRITHRTQLVMAVIIVLIGLNASVEAAAPPAPPSTIWNFLGIPKTLNKMRDTTSNRRGNRPGAERTDPIKRIADPANLESPNSAIKAAAQVKADQDLAPQKIKAIKYLATVGCGCYQQFGVREALLDSLDDCTEEVRYEAAVAFCKAAGNPCKNCEKDGCCSAAVMQKLHDKAYGQDENCCYKESSARVRAAAEMALNACRRKVGPTAAPKEKEGETGKVHEALTPIEAPSDTPLPEKKIPVSEKKAPAPDSVANPAASSDPPMEKQPSVTLRILPSAPAAESREAPAVVQTSALMQVQPESGKSNESR